MSTLAALDRRMSALANLLQPPVATFSAIDLAERAGLMPDPWQRDVLQSDARQVILLCSRQAGKSTITSVLAAHRAITEPGALVLLVAPALRQSRELFLKTRGVLDALGDDFPRVTDNVNTLELANGSRIVCLPGSEKTVRGYSAPALVIEDEAARVSDDMAMALRPMRATRPDGQYILLSSPFGKRGHFYETWMNGGPAWQRVLVTAYDCPRIDIEWLEQERLAIGDWWFRQEYGCQFLDSVDSFFRSEDIDAMVTDDVVPLFTAPEGNG